MKTRVISGAVIAIVMIVALLCGGPILFALNLGIAVIGMSELYRIFNIHNSLIGIIGYLSAVAYYICVFFNNDTWCMFVIIIAMMAIMSAYVCTFPKYEANQAMVAVFALVYVAVMLSYIYKTRAGAYGIYVVWLIFVCSWINDTFAYFTGICIGKHKMTPRLSPKKSVEGAIGGVVSATVVGAIYGHIIAPYLVELYVYPELSFAIASCVGALISIIGDLAASAIKRNYNIKDYSNLIPGHGGILDRFDSVIYTAPAVYIALMLINM